MSQPTDYRALCAELLEKYDLEWRARERIKTALAQIESTQPKETVDQRFEFSVLDREYVRQAWGTASTYAQALDEGQRYLAEYSQDGPHTLELRRVEILPHHALTQSEPEGLIAEQEAIEAYDFAYRKSAGLEHYGFGTLGCTENHRAGLRAVLARLGRPAIEPVTVSERLPGPEDCDSEGRCWWAANDGIHDHWRKLDLDKALNNPWRPTHWLPHYALPVPE